MKTTIMFAALIALALMLVAAPLAMAEDTAVVTDDSATADATVTDTSTTTETPNLISPSPTTDTTVDLSTQTVDAETTAEINDDLTEDVNGFQVGMEKVSLWFTFNQEKKAMKELKIAKLELIRARMAAKNGDSEGFDNAIAAHDALIERVRARISAVDGESTKKGVQGTAVKLVGLERAIEVHEARIQKLNDLLASSELSEEEIAKIQARLDKVQSNIDKLKEVEDKQKEKLRTKLMAVGEMTEEEADAEIQNIEATQNLDAVKKMIAEKKIANAEKFLEKLKERTAAAEAKGKDTTKAEARIATVEQKISEAKSFVESGNYALILGRLKQAENAKREASAETFSFMQKERARNKVRDKIADNSGDTAEVQTETSTESSDDSTTPTEPTAETSDTTGEVISLGAEDAIPLN